MITKRSGYCSICGHEIVTKGNWFNQIFIRQLHDWALEIHMRKAHARGYMKWWYIPLSVLEIVMGAFLRIVMALLWGITLPFWAVHEFCE